MSTLKSYKPTTPSRRLSSRVNYRDILTTDKPFKKLIIRKSRSGGRSRGKIAVRHIGGGSKKLIRMVNFQRNFSKGFKVKSVEYDPNRASFVSLVTDLNSGDNHYILHNHAFEVGKAYNQDKELEPGNQVELKDLPVGSTVSEVELQPGQGAKIVRSAGNYAEVTAKEDSYTTLKLPSGEIRKFLNNCKCVIGRVGNTVHELARIGKAGSNRNKGIRPTVRGKVMNPVDHPHGGGEARNSIGMKYPKTPWGKHALGVRTRNKKKSSGKLIIQRRKKK